MDAVRQAALMLTQLGHTMTVASRDLKIMHWNYRDTNFVAVHPYIDEVRADLDDEIDGVYEEMRKGGFLPEAKLSQALAESKVNEIPSDRLYNCADTMKIMHQIITEIRVEADALSTFADENKLWTIQDLANGILDKCSKVNYFIVNSSLETAAPVPVRQAPEV
jgi:DNA-binding ferritin-like protein